MHPTRISRCHNLKRHCTQDSSANLQHLGGKEVREHSDEVADVRLFLAWIKSAPITTLAHSNQPCEEGDENRDVLM